MTVSDNRLYTDTPDADAVSVISKAAADMAGTGADSGKQFLAEPHCHCSEFSQDSRRSLAEMLLEADRKQVDVLVMTDHYDKDCVHGEVIPHLSPVGAPPVGAEWVFDLATYRQIYAQTCADRAQDAQAYTRLLLGIEVGFQPYLAEELSEYFKERPFDQIIGSIHVVDGLDIAQERDQFKHLSKQYVFGSYLENIIEMCESSFDFDVAAHFDYVARYFQYPEPYMTYAEFSDLFDHLFRVLIEREISLEINMRSRYQTLRMGGADPGFPDEAILRRYYELGGRLISVSTDAHRHDDLQQWVPQTMRWLKSLGFDRLTYFENRRPIQYPIIL